LSLVIGNHDIFGGLQTAEDIFMFPKKCKKVDYDLMVNNFVNYFKETFSNCVYKASESHFPFAKIIDGTLITGINSIARYSKIKNPFASNGEVSVSQFNELVQIFEQNKNSNQKLVLIHHYFNKIKVNKQKTASPFWQNIEKQTMKLKKKSRLFNLFHQYKVDLVLHGHLHESKEYFRKGIRFSNSGGSIKSAEKKSVTVNFINLSENEIKTEVHLMRDYSANTTILTKDEQRINDYKQNQVLSEASGF
jgi:predicted phosphodiesterase